MKEYLLWLAKFLTVLLVFFFFIPLLLGAVIVATQGGLESTDLPDSGPVVAVVELKGMIEGSKEVVSQLHKQVRSDRVKAIVLRIDSPGGAVAPSQDIYDTVKRLKERKPIVASMGNLAASGGLYAAMSASKVFAQGGTLTGSIGVIMQVPNFTHVAERVGVDVITIKSGKLKDVGNSFREMTEEERAFVTGRLETVHGQFISAVAEGRKLDRGVVQGFADGRLILGSEAKSLGLVDELGDVHAAARAALELAGAPLEDHEEPKLYYPAGKLDLVKEILENASSLTRFLSHSAELRYVMP